MKTLEHANYNSLLRHMRILADAALTHYDLGSVHLSLLSHRVNTVFRVTTSSRAGRLDEAEETSSTRFVLRLCSAKAADMALLKSELLWLSALRQETNLIVPEPVFTRNDAFITEVAVEGISEARRCILFHWVEGRFVDAGLSPTLLERVGTFMARLHQHAKHFVPSTDFVRPHWEWQMLFGPATILDPTFVTQHCDNLFTAQARGVFVATAERVGKAMQIMPKDANQYGLIHSDLQQTNYLFHKGDVHAIDFDDCCWGYFLFDVAITLSGIAGRPDEDALRTAFFKGYEVIRPLPSYYEEHLSIFTALSIVKRINYLFRSDNPAIHADAASYLAYALQQLGQFIAIKTS